MDNSAFAILFLFQIINQVILVFTLPREALGYKEVQEDPESKGISFAGVEVVTEGFRGHIQGAANNIVLFDLLVSVKLDRKPEVADLKDPVIEEDVGWLDVSVDDVEAGQLLAADAHLVGGFPPIEILVGSQNFLQGASRAELSHDVAVVLGEVDVLES